MVVHFKDKCTMVNESFLTRVKPKSQGMIFSGVSERSSVHHQLASKKQMTASCEEAEEERRWISVRRGVGKDSHDLVLCMHTRAFLHAWHIDHKANNKQHFFFFTLNEA